MQTDKAEYRVWWPKYGGTRENARPFAGRSHRDAVERWAEWYDFYTDEYRIAGGEAAEVKVLREEDDEIHSLTVIGRMERMYKAKKNIQKSSQ